MVNVYWLEYATVSYAVANAPRFPDLETSVVAFDFETFGSVFWRTGYAAVTHPRGTRLVVTKPPRAQFKCCLYDVIKTFLELPAPELTADEQEAIYYLPAGMALSQFRRYWPAPLPELPHDIRRLNYYLGVYNWKPQEVEYIHPEFDRPLLDVEHNAIVENHVAAELRLTQYLYGLQYVRDPATDVSPAMVLTYNVQSLDVFDVAPYRSRRLVKRLTFPTRLEWME